MNKEEIQSTVESSAKAAAEEAVRQTFRMFGVDTDSQDSVNEFRSDLVFAHELRKTTKGVKSKILMVVVGVITVSAVAAMSRGFGFGPK